MRSPLWGLALGLACGALVACAGGAMHASTAPASQADAGLPTGRGDPNRAEIERLANEIAQQRATDGFTTPATPLAQPFSTLPKSTDDACHHGTGDTCTSACTIADSICDNAGKICALADKMAGDKWAADKCTDAQASCAEANTKCCGCQ
jgi:hypothetical protein